MKKHLAAILVAALSAACTQALPLHSLVAPRSLGGTDDAAHAIPATGAKFTVLIFFADHCPCQAAHDPRLRALDAAFRPRGVTVYAVDSEAHASPGTDKEEAGRRGYPFPILRDADGSLARALHVEFATEAFVLDARGALLYHGAIDSDRKRLHDDAEPYLRDALDQLLAGRAPIHPETEALGCALELP